MKEYHKIQSIFKRDQTTKEFLVDQYSIPEFALLKGICWVWTEKIDGTNIRIFFDGEKVKIGGRTENTQISTRLYERLTDIFTIEKFKDHYSELTPEKPICLYGEGYGDKIQKVGGQYLPDSVDFILFDVTIGNWQLKMEDVIKIADVFNIDSVPIVGHGPLNRAIELVKKGFISKIGTCIAEGLVLRPLYELRTRSGSRIICKIKHKDFKNTIYYNYV